jgi:hypothetical protein
MAATETAAPAPGAGAGKNEPISTATLLSSVTVPSLEKQKGGPKAALSFADRRAYAAPATSSSASRTAGASLCS